MHKTRVLVRRGVGLWCAALSLTLVAACGSTEGGAQDGGATEGGGDNSNYPERSITWIVAFDPGGGSDTEFRRLQPHLEEALGVSVEVEYRPGADGGVGWSELVNAEPDGYTIGGIVTPHIVLQPMVQGEGSFSTDGFGFVSANVQAPQALIVSAEDPAYEDFEDFAADVEDNPGEVSVGASARLNLSHIIATELAQEGLETNYVSTGEGSTSVVTGVAGGHFPVGMLGANHAVGSDEVRAIAVSSDDRFEALPDVPTFKELGIDVVGMTSWGVATPKDTPMEIRQTLADAILAALDKEEVQESVAAEGQQVLGYGPEETKEFVSGISGQYEEIVALIEEQEGE
ncbi:tripartite tricarboxylate transporter substrate binding protein [Salinactinospora qingdaonensis]|uniref:Tripartite-type tricarboxylate transporter, receptor component TctC n=1 Tax=Salinactinospora qingdaonensis TaxID=702744 RepID=A0ABP7G267_9ACTN